MKALWTLILLCFTSLLPAQLFREVLPNLPFSRSRVEMDYADVDGDNDLDIFVVGRNTYDDPICQLYLNDGSGNFTKAPAASFPDPEIWRGTLIFLDVNGDAHMDYVVIGSETGRDNISKVYLNDGRGNFAADNRSSLPRMLGFAMDYADVDNDNDLDILITGKQNGVWVAYLYLNDGTGKFTQRIDTPSHPFSNIEAVYDGSVDFADINGDGNQDVLITGENPASIRITKLYTNDGQGNFTEVNPGANLLGVSRGKGIFVDVNNDGSQDIFVHGETGATYDVVKLYLNDGFGNFSYFSNTDVEPLQYNNFAFADVDGDQDLDLFLSGTSNNGKVTLLYENDGTGFFSKNTSKTLIPNISGLLYCLDLNGDGSEDLLLSGSNYTAARTSRMYLNDGAGNFTDATGSSFETVNGPIEIADINGDGSEDVFLRGRNTSYAGIAKFYLNDGQGNFTDMATNPLGSSTYYSYGIADLDGDNDLDLIIGEAIASFTIVLKRFLNDGTGLLTETPRDFVPDSINYFSALKDLNGDGFPDMVCLKRNGGSQVFFNDGTGNFSLSTNVPLKLFGNGSMAFADVDGDLDTDVLIVGEDASNGFGTALIAELYLNDGSGNFSEVPNTPFVAVEECQVVFADVDGNGSQDVLICGADENYQEQAKLYLNDGQGNFTEKTNMPFVDNLPPVLFGDIDGNGTQDLLMAKDEYMTYYKNDGQGNFTEVGDLTNPGLRVYYAALADLDGNGSPDLVTTGTGQQTRLFLNEIQATSVRPEIPMLDFVVYPNPTTSHDIELQFTADEAGELSIKVFDLNGRLLHIQKESIGIGAQNIYLGIPSLPKGNYLIHVYDGERMGVKKWVIH